MAENLVLYDWLSMTSKIHSADETKELIGLKNVKWESTKSAHGYIADDNHRGFCFYTEKLLLPHYDTGAKEQHEKEVIINLSF